MTHTTSTANTPVSHPLKDPVASKPVLILLPGWAMDSFVWEKLIGELSNIYEIHFITWKEANNITDYVQLVVRYLQRNSIKHFSLLGWSLGSMVAMELAGLISQKQNLPELTIDALILIGATSSFVTRKEEGYNIGWDPRILKRMMSRVLDFPEDTLRDFCKNMFSEQEILAGYHDEFMTLYSENEPNLTKEQLYTGLDYLVRTDLRNQLKNIFIPTLLICGEKDGICSYASSEYIKNRLPNARMHMINNCGHMPFFTDVSSVMDCIVPFTMKK